MFPQGCLSQLRYILREFFFGVMPREVSVRLAEAEFGQSRCDLWTRKRFRQKQDVRMFSFDFCNTPLPERKGFRVRIVDTKDPHTLLDPKVEDAL